jgi:subtilisin family serine protease
MNTGRALTFACVLLATLGVAGRSFGATAAARAPREIVVGFQGPTTRSDLRHSLHREIGAEVLREAAYRPMDLVRVDENRDFGDALEAYRARPEVAFAHPNWIGRGGFTPDDTQWPAQWHHRNVGQSGGTAGADLESEAGWSALRGSASVTVAVLDTGIEVAHPEFAGRIVAGWDFVQDDADPSDDHGHGTMVAGVLAANADNGFAVAGVDHFCKILPIKVLDSSAMGTTFDLISGLDYARNHGADVINMSLIDYPTTSGLTAALQAAQDAGIVLVACAGNGGLGDADVSGPGVSPHTISVGATNDQDERTGFSGTGAALEYVAPGRNVETVVFGSTADMSMPFSGCSAATPIVAGIASILRSMDPSLDTDGVRALLQAGAEDQVGFAAEDTPGWDEYHGWGRVNLRRTLEAAIGPVAAVAEPAPATIDVPLIVTPNPARSAATLRFSLPGAGWVAVHVYDVAGRHVRTLADGARSAGTHAVTWDALGDRGTPAPPGVYFLRVSLGDTVVVRKVTLVR